MIKIVHIIIFSLYHRMNILNEISDCQRLLVHIVCCTPHISILHSLEIRKQFTFIKQLLYIGNASINRAVINQKIRIFRTGIKFFYLYIHGRTLRFRIA